MIRMKTKFLLASCVLAAAVAGCQNEEFEAVNVGGQAASDLVEVGDNFMISGVGAVAPGTRTQWVEGTNAQGKTVLMSYFTPIIPMTGSSAATNTTLGGTAVIAPTIGACALVGGNVYSNYEFYHYGWLATGQNSADFSDCPGADDLYDLDNGWLYDDLTTSVTASSTEDVDAVISWTTGSPATMTVNLSGSAKSYNNESYAVPADVNLNSGIYKTENKAMFKGDYVLYYPYNDQFTEGMIPATSKVAFNDVEKEDLGSLDVAENTFRYAYAPDMVGGTTAASFEFKNLSGIVKITVKGANNQPLTNDISKLMLYSEKDGFLTKVYLDPSAIAAGKEGTEIYANGNKETNKTILVNMASGSELNNGDAVYISALPTAVSDLVVYAYANDKWAECTIGTFEITAGIGRGLEVTYADDDFEDKYLAVDTESLIEAIKNAKVNATVQKPATIEVLGNITLDKAQKTYGTTNNGRYDIPANVIITGDKIIVPEDVMLVVNSGATIESTIDVEGKSCCTGTNGGALYVQKAGVLAGTVNVKAGYEGKKNASLIFNNNGVGTTASAIAATAEVNVEGAVTFEGATDIRGALNIAEDAVATVNAAVADVNVYGGIITNNGTFEVAAGKFALWGAQGSSSAQDGQYFKNNGKFIDNVGTVVGGATANMVMSAEAQYICKVDDQARLDEAYIQKTACNLIQIIGDNGAKAYDLAQAVQHKDKDVDIEVACADVKFKPSKEVTIGNLSVTSGDLTIDKTSVTAATETTPATYNALHVNGDIELYATFKTEKDVVGMTANNLTVYNQGSATFDKRELRNGVTLDVDQYITVEKGGTLTIVDATSANAALVNCAEVVNHGGTFNGVPNSGR